MEGDFKFKVPFKTTFGWTITVTFDKDVTSLNVYDGHNEACNGKVCTFKDKGHNKKQRKDKNLELTYRVSYSSSPAPKVVGLCFKRRNRNGGKLRTATTPTSGILYMYFKLSIFTDYSHLYIKI